MKSLSPSEAADVIGRFLEARPLYPQEWNDFIEGRKVEQRIEPYRKRCYEIDPLVNRPGSPDSEALEELKRIASALSEM